MSALHPRVAEVAAGQLRTLRGIYIGLGGLILAILIATLVLGAPLRGGAEGTWWIELALGLLSLLLLGLLLPLLRRRLLGTARLQRLDAAALERLGLPAELDRRIGRQAVYLTRYTAGCVVSWGLCAAVALYGLVVRMLGAGAWETGGFFALAVFVLALLPPQRQRLFAALESLGAGPPGSAG
jgi:hypothetical protein